MKMLITGGLGFIGTRLMKYFCKKIENQVIFKGILTPKEILAGFANEQIAVIVLLLVMGNIIQKTSVIDLAFAKMLFT